MKIIFRNKKNGTQRIIYRPCFVEKARLRLELIKLNERILEECNLDIVHGFVPNRNPVTNAMCHIGYEYTLNLDLKDFFNQITPDRISNLTQNQISICFPDGSAKQGLPTSPALSNLAMVEFDKELNEYCIENKIKYTRYADDLSFSSNNLINLKTLLNIKIPEILKKYKFELNPRKTRIQHAKFGRRNITGIMVGNDKIYSSRKIRRILRSCIHRGNRKKSSGLNQWIQLKTPNRKNSKRCSKAEKTLSRHMIRVFNGEKDL